jgi:hypothetical protein
MHIRKRLVARILNPFMAVLLGVSVTALAITAPF